jgi:hypothetical protein
MVKTFSKHYVSTDAWRGYKVPAGAVAGVSYTGEYEDSPMKHSDIEPDIKALRQVLKDNGITSSMKSSGSSNLFMIKRWICVDYEDYNKAYDIVKKWLREHEDTPLHDAD